MGHFVEVCRRGLQVSTGKSKVIVSSEEKGLESEVCMAGMRLEYVSELKYLGCIVDESGTDEREFSRRR